MKKNVYFVSGIDTNIGKSYATAYLARVWREKGINVITQKFIQTGNPAGYSEDIELHRRLMGLEYLPEDEQGWTKPGDILLSCLARLGIAHRQPCRGFR